MLRKFLAIAVAGALAAPGLALAQSSVTIRGWLHVSVDNIKFSQPVASRTTTSESRLTDDASRIIFNVREDLGSGLAAIVQVDVRPNPDSGAINTSGESYVGLSSTAGRFTAGRHNFHRNKTPYDGQGLGVTRMARPNALIDYLGGGAVPIANATRTPNSLMWSSPKWGGFALDAGYSFNPANAAWGSTGATGSEADLTAGNTARKGRAWMLNPTFSGQNWHIAYSYWNGKIDAPGAATAAAQLASSDQRSDQIYGYYTWGGFKLGAMWNKSKLKAAATSGALAPVGTELSNRTAWSIPIRYTWGQHNFVANYTKARDDKVTAAADGARLWAVSYAYSLSKRTFVSLTYVKLTNDAGALYNLDTNTQSVNSAAGLGEDPRLLSLGVRHNF